MAMGVVGFAAGVFLGFVACVAWFAWNLLHEGDQ
jgi:hypothetical protein